jgi:hypothetical protein
MNRRDFMKSAALAVAAFAAAKPHTLLKAAPAKPLAPIRPLKIHRVWTLDLVPVEEIVCDEYGFEAALVTSAPKLDLTCEAFYRHLDPLPPYRPGLKWVSLKEILEFGLDPGLARHLDGLPDNWIQSGSSVTATRDDDGPLLIIKDSWRNFARAD